MPASDARLTGADGDAALKVLVTGGAGFIGHHAVRALQDSLHQVLVVDNLSAGSRENLPEGTQLAVVDILDGTAVADVFAGFHPDVVLHLAAKVSIRGSVEDFAEDARQNFLGTAVVLEAAIKARTRRFVFASSMAVYDDSPRPQPLDESWPTRPLSPYGISKLAAEQLVQLMGRRAGVETLVLRLFNTFGTGQTLTPYVGVITIFINRILSGMPPVIFGDGSQRRDFVYVGDVARACVLAVEGRASGASVNVGTGTGTAVSEVAALLLERLGSRLEPEYVPARAEENRNSIADISLARSLLGYEPQASLSGKIDEVIQAQLGAKWAPS